jgi:hypothetical protein
VPTGVEATFSTPDMDVRLGRGTIAVAQRWVRRNLTWAEGLLHFNQLDCSSACLPLPPSASSPSAPFPVSRIDCDLALCVATPARHFPVSAKTFPADAKFFSESDFSGYE